MNQNQDTTPQTNQTEEIVLVHEEEVEELKQCLPKANWMGSKLQLINFQGFWFNIDHIRNLLTFQRHFQAQHTDLIIAGFPKTGTTWLKSLLISILERSLNPLNKSPLLTKNPHELVYNLELAVYGGNPELLHQLDELPSPRLFSTHLPYELFPESIKDSGCKILYISRNPFDTAVSNWHFYPNVIKKVLGDENENLQPQGMEDFFEDFCQGRVFCGPFFQHLIGYWKQSLERPEKVLFLKYEDLKDNPDFYIKKLGEFVGRPFSPQEEDKGVVKEIVDFCSINNLKELEVNKSGLIANVLEKKSFFRKGKVGDWKNHFTPLMVDRMNKLMEQKLGDTGLFFKLQPE